MMKKQAMLVSLFSVCACLWAQRYYESNALGMPIREIPAYRTDEFVYVLEVEEQGSLVIQTLLKDEAEHKRWELQYGEGKLESELVYADGVLEASRQYDAGALVEEVLYEAGEIAEKRIYDYSDGFLKEVRAFDGAGDLIYTDSYERSAAGRLRRVKRISGEGRKESAFIYSAGELVEEWHGGDDEGVLFRYHGGEKLAEETWEGLKLLLAEEIKILDGKKEIVVEDSVLGTTTTRYYDEEDRVKIERIETAEDLLEHLRYDYEGENVTQKTRITRSAKEDWVYEYDDKGVVVRETLMRNTWVIKVIEHTGENEYYEEIYRDGVPSLRVYFKDGRKESEVFIEGEAAQR